VKGSLLAVLRNLEDLMVIARSVPAGN